MADKPTYTPQRAATVRLTQAIQGYLDTRYPNRRDVPKPEKDTDGYLDVWLAIHGDEGTPGMVFADTGVGIFEWEVIREARRYLTLGTDSTMVRAKHLLDSLLASAPDADVDPGELVNREDGMMAPVIYHAVNLAAERFNSDPADPGFSSDMHEDMLRDAAIEYAQAILARRAHGA